MRFVIIPLALMMAVASAGMRLLFSPFSLLVRGSVHQVDGKWEFVDTVQSSFPAFGWMNSVQNVTGMDYS